MEQTKFENLKRDIQKTIAANHAAALMAIQEFIFFRRVGESFDVRRGYKEEKREFTAEENVEKDITGHFVMKAEAETDKVVKEANNATRHLYKAMFNPLIFVKLQLDQHTRFVETVLKSKKIPDDVKAMIGKGVLDAMKKWHNFLESVNKDINSIFAGAKDRKTLGLALKSLVHTKGASYIRMRQQRSLINDAFKVAAKTGAIERMLEDMKNVRNKEEAEAEIRKLRDMITESEQKYEKAEALLAIEWKEVEECLNDLYGVVEKGTAAHELPQMDTAQLEELRTLIFNSVTEHFLESMRKAMNQLDTKVGTLVAETEKLARAA